MKIIWCMVGSWDIWRDRVFCHFGLFFCSLTLLTTQKIKILKKGKENPGDIIILHFVYHKWRSYNVWFLRYEAWHTIWCMVPQIWCMTEYFCHFAKFFALLPHWQPKKSKFWISSFACHQILDIIISHKCIKNHDHMLHCSWDMAHGRCNFCFSSFALLPHPLPPYSPNNQFLQNWNRKPRDIIMCTKNYYQMMYGYWNMVH